MIDRFHQITAFFLLLILGGNFLLSAVWPFWQSFLPHDHIFLGPVDHGWEHHHKQQLAHLETTPDVHVSTVPDAGLMGQVISLYRSPTGGESLFSVGVPLLWLSEWPLPAEFASRFWALIPIFLLLSSAFLPPPDKPPVLI